MVNVIGVVRLAKGRVGYFDELTRIHLTISSPERPIYAGMNTANIKRAVHSGVLRLISGSLELEVDQIKKDMHKEAPKAVEIKPAPKAEAKPEVVVPAPVVEEIVEAPVVEEVVEEAPAPAEEVVAEPAVEEEVAPKKNNRRKKAAEPAETAE